ncbi:calcium sensing receptor, chloroplastic-like isoform X2 [Salvia miltiorrhiza]|uniref:calcium sensing receptor, chloroplastic-like isoform X2 n=1 Tax=Salvia miltiorrhiza TaxID=226208 RepID=UPI0025AC649D|nr:calcium sensing receptor, chloroplastic-like isoform X2 [Salvia miltiorrhiza]
MFPLSSATTKKVSVCGGLKSISPHGMRFDAKCNGFDKVFMNFSNSLDVRTRPSSCLHLNNVGNTKLSLYPTGFQNLRQCKLSCYQVGHCLGSNNMMFVDGDELVDFLSNTIDNAEAPPSFADVESVVPSRLASHSFHVDTDALSFLETKLSDIVSKLKEAAADASNIGEDFLNKFSDSVTLPLTTNLKDTNRAVSDSINEIISFINKSAGPHSHGSELSGLCSELKEASSRAWPFALDVLRGTIVVVENSLERGGKIFGYAYSSVKEFLPPEVQVALGLSEERVEKVLSPAGNAFQQVYMAVEGFEESLGLDPNDPLVPFVLFLGLSVTLWASYRIVKYSGYAGDFSPQPALEFIQGNENAVLVDIRPENFKERDGVPDLRRAARFRYASVILPEVDGSTKKLLKGGRDIEYTLLAAVIRNLNIVDDRSIVLVMDADGTFSKGVARSLRKLGTKKPYIVKGGFRTWVKNGLRVKIAKPETALTIINEEAEAILEEIKPTPLKTIGYGVVFVGAIYSVVEWEKTLQFIGVIGLGQVIGFLNLVFCTLDSRHCQTAHIHIP